LTADEMARVEDLYVHGFYLDQEAEPTGASSGR